MPKLVAVFFAVFALAYLALWGSKPAVDALMKTDMSILLEKPREFDGRRVVVSGAVERSAAIFGIGGYVLRHGEAEILIVTTRGTPKIGSHITVQGTFKQAIQFDRLQYPVIFEKD